ncbi:hypothetical protein J6590_100700 [Homalodisca vitripennis]|nr:hypothetical protein J6590_100700 [Homalodisca vitripennis]
MFLCSQRGEIMVNLGPRGSVSCGERRGSVTRPGHELGLHPFKRISLAEQRTKNWRLFLLSRYSGVRRTNQRDNLWVARGWRWAAVHRPRGRGRGLHGRRHEYQTRFPAHIASEYC